MLWLLADHAKAAAGDGEWVWPLRAGGDGELERRLEFMLGERAAGLPKVLLRDHVPPEVKLEVGREWEGEGLERCWGWCA